MNKTSITSTSRKTRKIKPSLKLQLNKSLKKASKINKSWTQKLQLEDNYGLKQILKDAHTGLKEYKEDLLEANNIVNRLEANENLTDNDVEDALLELELIQYSIQSYHSKNAELKKKLKTLKTNGGKSKKYAYNKMRNTKKKKKYNKTRK